MAIFWTILVDSFSDFILFGDDNDISPGDGVTIRNVNRKLTNGPCKAKEARSACKGKEVSAGPRKSVSRPKVLTHLRTQDLVLSSDTTKRRNSPTKLWTPKDLSDATTKPKNCATTPPTQGFDCVSRHANNNGSGTQKNCRTIYIDKL